MKVARLVPLLLLLALGTALCEPLPAPQELIVERDGRMFRGRWQAVKGASFYEVWINSYGGWSFNSKKLETSPFTSSFEIPVSDERSLFKVRAVDSSGIKGEFSADSRAVLKKTSTESTTKTSPTRNGSGTKTTFDPKAPPPKPPTGLFCLWTDSTTLKVVWRGVSGAKRYSLEEYRDGKWTSVPLVEFPKPNNALLKNYPTPGPYRFRVRSVGANGRASEPSRPTTAKR